ncbi:MAG: helix-turn-helix domain-containing protein [Candidatus Pacearchaeota archaeon]
MVLDECSVCGVSGEKERLLEAVSLEGKGIVKVCDLCAQNEGIPVIRRPTTFQLKESEKEQRIYNRPKENKQEKRLLKNQNIFRQDKGQDSKVNLNEIANRNYEQKVSQDKKPRPELVYNFHWTIMRARQSKKLTREQLAKEISESVSAIKMAEKGILPDDDYVLVNKLESFLGIKLSKGDLKRSWKQSDDGQPAKIIKFDPVSMKNLTIDDLRRLKEMRKIPQENSDESENFEEDVKRS